MAETVRLTTAVAALRASLLLAGWLVGFYTIHAAGPASISIHWNTNSNPPTVEIAGIGETTLRQLRSTNWQSKDWQGLLSVYAGQGDFMADMNVPPMLGSCRVENRSIHFHPQFPLQSGVTYRAVLRPSKLPGADNSTADIVSKFQLPAVTQEPSTVVAQIFPSGDVLPENLLKFYVHFSAPMRGGHIYQYIRLLDDSGRPVELPFLELDEELWNLEMTRLTLFIDPGRIKRGVQPLEEIGPALEAGRRYTLEIDAAWRDNSGLPLRETFRKSFLVSAPDRKPPDTATWNIQSPQTGTRDVLTLDFSEPMDHALALRVIRVADVTGRLVEGVSALSNHEQRWSFTPEKAWTAGEHQLRIENTIEDLAGNNIGKAFEMDLSQGAQRRFTSTIVKLPFDVR